MSGYPPLPLIDELAEIIETAVESGGSGGTAIAADVRSFVDRVVRELEEEGIDPREARASAWKAVVEGLVAPIIRRALERNGLSCTLYLEHVKHKEIPNIVASCRTRTGETLALEIDLAYDPLSDTLQIETVAKTERLTYIEPL